MLNLSNHIRLNILRALLCLIILIEAGCSGDQFAAWRVETFDTTPITTSSQKTIYIHNKDSNKEQHIRGIGFDKGSNAPGHFRVDSVMVGEQSVAMQDIVIPPGGTLAINATYTPMNLETTFASYGGWETGRPERWLTKPPDEVDNKKDEETEAIHRSILQATYDYPKPGIVQIELVGFAVEGPNGEIAAGGIPGECTPGNGVVCYSGKFSVDIPQLYTGGPRDIDLTGDIKFYLTGNQITWIMDDMPPALMALKSTEIPELPSGVTATLIISGSKGVVAEGTFDGTRINLDNVSFRIRFVLGELTADDITSGIASMIDFDIPELELTTTEALNRGEITLHLETTLSESPAGDPLFDQFLSNANVILVMQGELNM